MPKEFNIPNDSVDAEDRFFEPISQEELRRVVDEFSNDQIKNETSSQDIEVKTEGGIDVNPSYKYRTDDPLEAVGSEVYDLPDGWQLIYPDSIDSPAIIGFRQAYLFFPHSDGVIQKSMPTLQNTGTPLDDAIIPSLTLSGAGTYLIYLFFDSTNDISRVFVLDETVDPTTETTATESYVAIGEITFSGTEITEYTPWINGPEAIGGGGAAEECTALKVSVNANTVGQNNGQINNTNPTLASGVVAAVTSVWFCADYVPNVNTENIGGTNYHFMEDTGTFSNMQFVVQPTEPANVTPDVNLTTGAVTNGKAVSLWAVIDWDGVNASLNYSLCGNFQLDYCNGQFRLHPL